MISFVEAALSAPAPATADPAVNRMSRATLFLIDGSSQMYRAYHAFRGRGLSNQEGHTTHAVYVFVTMLRKLIADHKPAYMAASFDLAGPTFRDRDRRRLQGEPRRDARRPCGADQLGAPGMRSDGRADRHGRGYEADDVIGTLAKRAAAQGFEVAIVSIDKDFFQLVARRHPRLRPARGRRVVRRRRASSRNSA